MIAYSVKSWQKKFLAIKYMRMKNFGIFKSKNFPPDDFVRYLEQRAQTLQRQEREKEEDDDDD